MKKLFMYGLLIGCLATPITILGQEMVTVKGRIVDRETGKPPYVLVAVNEKGVGDYYVLGDRIGSNHHVLMNRDGKFKIKIKEGGSLIVNSEYPYKNFEVKNIVKSTHLKIELDTYPDTAKPTSLSAEVAKVGTRKYTVKGKITNSITGKPLKYVTVSERWVYNENGNNRYVFSDKEGNYSFTIHEGNSINFDGMGYETQVFDNIDSNRTINISFRKKQE